MTRIDECLRSYNSSIFLIFRGKNYPCFYVFLRGGKNDGFFTPWAEGIIVCMRDAGAGYAVISPSRQTLSRGKFPRQIRFFPCGILSCLDVTAEHHVEVVSLVQFGSLFIFVLNLTHEKKNNQKLTYDFKHNMSYIITI